MVETGSTVADDGKAIIYALDPQTVCAEEPEEPESDEDEAERLAEEADCLELFDETPVSVQVTSDGPGRVDLSLRVGADPLEVVYLQLHEDVIAPFVDIGNLAVALEAFTGLDLPGTASGLVAAELRQEGSEVTSGRFAVEEAIALGTEDGDIGFQFAAHETPGWFRADGTAMTIDGGLDLGAIALTLPWTEEESDVGEWDVVKHLEIDVPAVHGTLAFDGAADRIELTGAGIGDRSTEASVSGDTIVAVDLNPLDGRQLDLVLTAPSADDIQVEVAPVLDVQVAFAMHHVEEDMDDELPDVLADDTIGVLLDDSQAPAIRTRTTDGEMEIEVVSGSLTLWSDMMNSTDTSPSRCCHVTSHRPLSTSSSVLKVAD